MKLTVGPLPAGVYWRRRAIVGGVLLVVALMLWVSCGNDDPGGNKTSAGASSSPSQTAEPTMTIQVPSTGEAAPPSSAPASSSSAPVVTSTVPVCADADLTLTATPEQPVQFRGAYLKFTLKVKNVSGHDCVRDLGADFQELYIQVGAAKIWSSDKCDAPTGRQLTTMKPGIEHSFENTWNGKTNQNCDNREIPPAGKYQLVARLETKISEPVTVQLT